MDLTALALHVFATGESDLVSKPVGDGVQVVVVGVRKGPSFRVERRGAGAPEVVFTTAFADEAASVFEHCGATDKPWHGAYRPVGKLPAAREEVTDAIRAVGATVEDCVEGFLESIGETLEPDSLAVDLDQSKPEFQWGARFVSRETGTGFRAAGRRVPGGYVMTWRV